MYVYIYILYKLYIYICCWNVRCFNVSVTRDFVRGAQLRIAKARHARLDHVVNPTMNHTQFIPVQQFGVYHELTKLHAGLFVYVLSEKELRNRLCFPPTSIGDQRYTWKGLDKQTLLMAGSTEIYRAEDYWSISPWFWLVLFNIPIELFSLPTWSANVSTKKTCFIPNLGYRNIVWHELGRLPGWFVFMGVYAHTHESSRFIFLFAKISGYLNYSKFISI